MPKGNIKLQAKPGEPDAITMETRYSHDKKTYVVVMESTCPESELEFRKAVYIFMRDELRKALRRN